MNQQQPRKNVRTDLKSSVDWWTCVAGLKYIFQGWRREELLCKGKKNKFPKSEGRRYKMKISSSIWQTIFFFSFLVHFNWFFSQLLELSIKILCGDGHFGLLDSNGWETTTEITFSNFYKNNSRRLFSKHYIVPSLFLGSITRRQAWAGQPLFSLRRVSCVFILCKQDLEDVRRRTV